ANSARDAFAPIVLLLATLLPMTSRLRAAAFSPLNPCWKDIRDSCSEVLRGFVSKNRADGGRGNGLAPDQLEPCTARPLVHSMHACRHEGRHRQLGAIRVHAPGAQPVLAGCDRPAIAVDAIPVEGMHARLRLVKIPRMDDATGGVDDLHAHRTGRSGNLEAD